MSQNLDELHQTINCLTKISNSDRQKSLRWLARQNDLVMYDVFKLQKNHFHRLKSQNIDDDLLLLSAASLFLALKEAILSSQIPKRKHKSSDFSFLRHVAKNRAKQFQKPRKKAKYDRLTDLSSVVLSLVVENGYSYRAVSRCLLKYHKFEVSHTLIGDFYRDIKEANHG